MNLPVILLNNDTTFTVICEKMTPYIAFSKSQHQLTCMCRDMARHHDQVTDYGMESPTPDISLLTGCPASDCALPYHPEDVVGNQPQFQYQSICCKFAGWKTLKIHICFYLAMELFTFPMGMVQPNDFFVSCPQVCPPGFDFYLWN